MNKDHASTSDEEIIFPESEIIINDERIIVNEITYMQGMQLHSCTQPVIEDMAQAFADETPGLAMLAGVFAKHAQGINEMIMLTTDKDENWLLALNDEDGQSLLMTFWIVNSGFFTRRLASKSLQKMQETAQQNQKTAFNTEKSSLN